MNDLIVSIKSLKKRTNMASNNLRDYSKIIVIGNGFDLNLGLETRYSDFIATNEFKNICKSGNELCKFLKRECELALWIDVELKIKEYAHIHSFRDEEGKVIQDFSEPFFNDYKELCNSLTEYLNKLDYGVINKQSEAYKLVNEQCKGRYLILDFNFTPSIDLINPKINEPNKIKRHIKVHGSCREKNIIFGIQEDPNIPLPYAFIKKAYNDNYNPADVSKYLLEAEQIHFFGHSLGETDEYYFKPLFRMGSNREYDEKKIHIYYHGEEGKRGIKERLSALIGSNSNEFMTKNALTYESV